MTARTRKTAYDEADVLNAARLRDQSVEDWLRDYEGDGRLEIVLEPQSPRTSDKATYRFLFHRTARNPDTKRGFLVLCFEEVSSFDEAYAFFNVDTTIQRGARRGIDHPMRKGGQFLPPARGAFRKLWMKVVRKHPRRWAAVHKEIRSALRGKLFTGDKSISYWPDGTAYVKLSNLRIATRKEHFGNKNGTTKEQDSETVKAR